MITTASSVVIVDTDVLSFLFHADPVRYPRYAPHLAGRTPCVSFVSIAEMRFGAQLRRWGPARCDRLESFLRSYTVIESNPAIGAMWAEIRCEAIRIGRTIERQDAWIAAVARTLDVPLVTHNASDYQHILDLQVITEPDR